MKNSNAPAVKREEEEEWGKKKRDEWHLYRGYAQSSLVAKATRQDNSIKSFRILMVIGAPLCIIIPTGSARQYLGQRVMKDWPN